MFQLQRRVKRVAASDTPENDGAAQWVGAVALGAWALAITAFFLSQHRVLLEPLLDSIWRVGLLALCNYSFAFGGWRVLSRLDRGSALELSPSERLLTSWGLGVGICMLVLFAAGAAGGLGLPAALAVVALPLLGNHVTFWREQRERFPAFRERRWSVAVGLLLALAAVMTLLESLTPAVSQDALVYHLSVPAQWIADGAIGHVAGNFFSAFPMNVEMLFTLGLLLDGDGLAKSFHWALGIASALAVACVARRVSSRGEGGGLSAALFATIPTVCLIGTWAYVDLGVVFFSTTSTLFFLVYRERGEGSATLTLGLSALMAGWAAGCKYTAGIQAILIVLALLSVWRFERLTLQRVVKSLAIVSSLVAVLVAPWYIKNWLATGNPMFPFAFSIFGGLDWDEQRAQVLAASLREWGGGDRSLFGLLLLPWDVTVGSQFFSQAGFDGVIGVAFLIVLPVLVFAARFSSTYRWVAFFALGHIALWVITTHQIRFLLPGLALVAALVPAAIERIRSQVLSTALRSVLVAAVAINVAFVSIHFAAHNPLPFVCGLEDRDQFLERELPGDDYSAFRFINERLPKDARVLFGSCGNPGFLCERPFYADAFFENRTLSEMLARSETADDVAREFQQAGFTHLIFRLDTVFDPLERKSEIPISDQALLSSFLNDRAELEYRVGKTMLYRVADR
ncbi:MAG: hypothetical protein AAF517_12025 [Planctomycetota bacterium]